MNDEILNESEINQEENVPNEVETHWYDDIVANLQNEFDFLEGKDSYIMLFINFASYKLQTLENNIDKNKEYDDFELYWIHLACREMIIREQELGIGFAIKYSENGYNVEFDDTCISKGLQNMIKPKVGVIK